VRGIRLHARCAVRLEHARWCLLVLRNRSLFPAGGRSAGALG
jgi:hypothetical protein